MTLFKIYRSLLSLFYTITARARRSIFIQQVVNRGSNERVTDLFGKKRKGEKVRRKRFFYANGSAKTDEEDIPSEGGNGKHDAGSGIAGIKNLGGYNRFVAPPTGSNGRPREMPVAYTPQLAVVGCQQVKVLVKPTSPYFTVPAAAPQQLCHEA